MDRNRNNDTSGRDVAAEALATLGLLNGSILVDGADGVPSLRTENMSVRIEIDGWDSTKSAVSGMGSFHEAVASVAGVLSHLALADHDRYMAAMSDIHAAGTGAWILCRPVGGAWPDAMEQFSPEGMQSVPSCRAFPLFAGAVDIAGDACGAQGDIEDMCRESPGRLFLSDAGADVMTFCGWSSKAGRMARMHAVRHDLREPWQLAGNPDGSDSVMPAQPMECIDAAANAWRPVQKTSERS